MRQAAVTSLSFFSRLKWLDGTPLLDGIEPYRRAIFTRALDSFDTNGRPLFNMVLAGRGKKNSKTLDLILAALFVLVIRRSVQGSDGYILANDADQAGDDLALAKKLVAHNPALANEIEPLAGELRLRDGSASLRILPARDTVGAHGKSAAFVGFDEIHGYRDWSLMEALQPDPTRADCLTWITSYASLFNTVGAPLHDLMQIGKAGKDPRMLFSWYSGDLCTDPDFAELPPLERANPSMASWPDGAGYLEQQRVRLPTGRFRRLHLNLPGSPEGAAFDQGKVLACVVPGRRHLAFEEGKRYVAAVDMSGGSSDDAVLGIAHTGDGKRAVLDRVVKQIGNAPFDPRAAVRLFASVLREYRITSVTGDAFSGQTFRQDFQSHGIEYVMRSTPASQLYELLEPALNAHEVELLDDPVLIEQLVSLVWRGNKITHENGSHDDHANAAALAINMLRDASQVSDCFEGFGVFTAPRHYYGESNPAAVNDAAAAYLLGGGRRFGNGGRGGNGGSVLW
jgi:phage terminase large subunit-like protein